MPGALAPVFDKTNIDTVAKLTLYLYSSTHKLQMSDQIVFEFPKYW